MEKKETKKAKKRRLFVNIIAIVIILTMVLGLIMPFFV